MGGGWGVVFELGNPEGRGGGFSSSFGNPGGREGGPKICLPSGGGWIFSGPIQHFSLSLTLQKKW